MNGRPFQHIQTPRRLFPRCITGRAPRPMCYCRLLSEVRETERTARCLNLFFRQMDVRITTFAAARLGLFGFLTASGRAAPFRFFRLIWLFRLLRFRQTDVRILVILFRLFRLRFFGLLRLFRSVRILLPFLGCRLSKRQTVRIRRVDLLCALIKTCNELSDQLRLDRSSSIDVFILQHE